MFSSGYRLASSFLMSCADRRRMSRNLLTGVAVGVLAACGVAASPGSATPSATGPTAAQVASLLQIPALPQLAVVTKLVTAADIAKDASIPGFADSITGFGYAAGVQRTFQGPSKHLTLAISRTLTFATPTGAAGYVAYVRTHATTYFGIGADISALTSSGRRGWLYVPPACACHMANPDVIGLVSDGPYVVSLEINGPDATPALLRRLLNNVGPRT